MKITCLLIDDEPDALELLESYIQKVPFLELKGTFTDPTQALKYLASQPVDLIFLDMHMDELTGLEFMQIAGNQYQYVLTTGHAQYAIKGYEFNVKFYLLKPISFDKFLAAVQKVSKQPLEQTHLSFKDGGMSYRIPYSEIICVQAKDILSILKTATNQYIVSTKLKNMEEQLSSPNFLRIHKSWIISLNYVQSWDAEYVYLKTNHPTPLKVPLGPTYRSDFLKLVQG